MSASIPLLCFNDVYRVNQRYVPQPGAPRAPGGADKGGSGGEISVSQFGQLIYDIRDGWGVEQGEDGEEVKQGLVLFAGDVFNPSVESSVTRGSHMVSRGGLCYGPSSSVARHWRGLDMGNQLIVGTRNECP